MSFGKDVVNLLTQAKSNVVSSDGKSKMFHKEKYNNLFDETFHNMKMAEDSMQKSLTGDIDKTEMIMRIKEASLAIDRVSKIAKKAIEAYKHISEISL